MAEFHGAKIAVIVAGRVLVMLRDEKADIPWPGRWDLPGGGREGDEGPEDCALRELREELSVEVDRRWLVWRRQYPGVLPGQGATWLVVAEVPEGVLGEVVLGDEGQDWAWMSLGEFLAHDGAIPHQQARVREYLRERAAREGYPHA